MSEAKSAIMPKEVLSQLVESGIAFYATDDGGVVVVQARYLPDGVAQIMAADMSRMALQGAVGS